MVMYEITLLFQDAFVLTLPRFFRGHHDHSEVGAYFLIQALEKTVFVAFSSCSPSFTIILTVSMSGNGFNYYKFSKI